MSKKLPDSFLLAIWIGNFRIRQLWAVCFLPQVLRVVFLYKNGSENDPKKTINLKRSTLRDCARRIHLYVLSSKSTAQVIPSLALAPPLSGNECLRTFHFRRFFPHGEMVKMWNFRLCGGGWGMCPLGPPLSQNSAFCTLCFQSPPFFNPMSECGLTPPKTRLLKCMPRVGPSSSWGGTPVRGSTSSNFRFELPPPPRVVKQRSDLDVFCLHKTEG